jgi:hypothetical protein
MKIKDAIANEFHNWDVQQVSRCFDRVHLLGVSDSEVFQLRKQLVSHALKLKLDDAASKKELGALLERCGSQSLLQDTHLTDSADQLKG